jgi:hypothetical protein
VCPLGRKNRQIEANKARTHFHAYCNGEGRKQISGNPCLINHETSSIGERQALERLRTYPWMKDLGPTGAPVILEMLIYYFNNKEEYLKEEGLFRKNVSVEDEASILNELNKKNYNYLETVTDPHLIASKPPST